MTQEETAQILAVLKAAYPNSYKGMTKQEAMGTVAVWHIHFANMPVDIVMMAVQRHIGQSSFPPSVYDVKKRIQSLRDDASDRINNFYGMYLPATPEIERIYELTREYEYSIPYTPSLREMTENKGLLLLEDR